MSSATTAAPMITIGLTAAGSTSTVCGPTAVAITNSRDRKRRNAMSRLTARIANTTAAVTSVTIVRAVSERMKTAS